MYRRNRKGLIGFPDLVVIDINFKDSRFSNLDKAPPFIDAVSCDIINLIVLAVIEKIPESTKLFVLHLDSSDVLWLVEFVFLEEPWEGTPVGLFCGGYDIPKVKP